MRVPALMVMVIVALCAAPAGVGWADEAAAPARAWTVRSPHQVRPLDPTAAARLAALHERSRIAADALRVLSGAPRLQLTVTSSPALLRRAGSRGLSRFWVEEGTLVGRLQFDTGESGPPQQARALAHELAHALELALLPRQADTKTLAALLLARLGRHAPWFSRAPIETPFALAVEKAIMFELGRGPAADPRALARIALEHGLHLLPGTAVPAAPTDTSDP